MLGFDSTEAQMAAYTHTRAGMGSTVIRAAEGLTKRLNGSGIAVRIVPVKVEQLSLLPCPMLLTVNFGSNPGFNHMIVILKTNAVGADVWDPTDGLFFMPWAALKDTLAGPAIIFDRHTSQQAIAQASR